jgi:hypothetical protein
MPILFIIFVMLSFGALYTFNIYENSHLRDIFFTATITYAVIAVLIFVSSVKH